MLTDIYLSTLRGSQVLSPGLANDARVIRAHIGAADTKVFPIPDQIYQQSRAQNDAALRPMRSSDTAIFLERVFDSSVMMSHGDTAPQIEALEPEYWRVSWGLGISEYP